MKQGYVKFDRKIKDWGWYTDLATFKLFFHLITFANYADGEYLGIPVKRGQIARSYAQLAKETGLSLSVLRTAINHLTLTQEVAQEKHTKFSIFTVNNYNRYQNNGTFDDDSEKHENLTQFLTHFEASKFPETTGKIGGLNQTVDTVFDTALTVDSQSFDTQSKKKNNNNNNKKKILSLRESTKEKPPDDAADFSTSPPREEKRAYGKHKNLYYTDAEWEDIKRRVEDGYVDTLSERFKEKGYRFNNHHEITIQWAGEKGMLKEQQLKKNEEPRCSGFDSNEFFDKAVAKTKRRREKAVC